MTKKTALQLLINDFKSSIDYLELCLKSQKDEKTIIQTKARLSQARYFLTFANEKLEVEKEQIRKSYCDSEYYNETYGGNNE
jgi:hypothetical protein